MTKLTAIDGGAARRQTQAPKGPTDGAGGGMEARIARLEEDMKEARGDLKAIRSDLSELKGKVSGLPGWPGLLTVAGVIIVAIAAIIRFLPSA